MSGKCTSAVLIIAILGSFLTMIFSAIASQSTPVTGGTVTIYFFWGEGCPHCAEAKPFLQRLASRHPELQIRSYEVFNNKENLDLFSRMAKSVGEEAKGVPAFFIGDAMFTGFSDEIARDLREKVTFCIYHGCKDPFKKAGPPVPRQPAMVKIPFLGGVSPTSFSLPLLTVVIAGLDSFNPCAFFVLFFLLSLLIHTHSRKKMVVVGWTFVFFSGLVYFLFMAAWLNIFLVIGNLSAVTLIAGAIALFISIINIKDFFLFHKGLSLVIPEKAKPNLFERMRNLLKASSSFALLAGTAVLALMANSYEIICTAGFPMVFTRMLTLHPLSRAEYYTYLAFYNIIYIIPLAVIVSIAVVTLGSRKLTVWQGRVLKLVSGLMMLCLALVLLINAALLNNALISAALLAFAVLASATIVYLTKRIHPGIEKL
jgi:thiol-disulfide isomerase/thioredoxin